MRTAPRTPKRPLVLVLLAVYLILAAVIAFWPTPVDADAAPLLTRLITKLHDHGMPTWLGYDHLEFTANVLFFIPLGALLTLLLARRRWWLAALIGLGASICIELVQQELLAARFSSLTDVAANSLGALIGALLTVWVTGRRKNRRR